MGKDTKKIYLVTRGEYSDYRILGAYSTEQKAQEYVTKHSSGDEYEDPGIEEFDLDPEDPTLPYICVHLTLEGNLASNYDKLQVHFKEPSKWSEEFIQVNNSWVLNPPYRFFTWVQTNDKTRAVKVASERLMRYKVENNL